MSQPQIILASASIGRKGLLEKLGVPFVVQTSTVDEEAINDADPRTRIKNRARAKAEDVLNIILANEERLESQPDPGQARMTKDNPLNQETLRLRSGNKFLIIAADSEALLNGVTYGKSKDKAHTKEIVKALMGHTHEFLTATCIIQVKIKNVHNAPSPPLILRGRNTITEVRRWENLTETLVTMRTMSAEEIEAYTTRYDFSRFAAAYTINETPWDLITKIDGSYTSVIGLPFEVVLPVFRELHLI